MPKYRTIVNGMNGTGDVIIKDAAPEIPEGREEQQAEAPDTGAAFTGGMRVTEDVKKQIEHGSAADFFYFDEAKDEKGKFDMHPKLPEYGCDGPGKPVFKLRENNNRLMKGFAQKFLGADGEPDLDKGMKFLQEWNLRFGISTETIPYSPEMPMGTNLSVLKDNAHNWLCEELEIPDTEREDFKNYLDASMSFYMDQKAINLSNTYSLWQGFARNLTAAQKMQSDPDSPYSGDKGKDDLQFQLNLQKVESAKKELKQLAAIDPAKEMKMLVPTECKGSRASNMAYVQLSDNAQVERGQKKKENVRKDPFFIIDIKGELIGHKHAPEQIERQMSTLKKEIENETDPARRDGKVQEMQDLSVKLAAAKERAANLPKDDDLKWEFHQAPVLGSFTTIQDGQEKRFYLTAEAFAPESDVLMDHPAVTDSVSIGVYSDLEDFRKFYRKDPLTIDNKYSAKMAKNKEEYAGAEFGRLMREEDEYRKLPLQQIDERERFKKVYKDAKEALGDRAKEMTADQKAFEQQIAFMRERRGDVPEEQKADYEKLITMSSQLLAKSTALEYNRLINDKALTMLPTMEEKHAFTVCMEMNPASAGRTDHSMAVMRSAIRSIQEGRDDFSLQGMSEQDAAAFHAFLKGKGMDPDRFVAAVNAAGITATQKMAANEKAYDFKVDGRVDVELQGFAQVVGDANADPEMRSAGGAGLDLRANTGLMVLNKLVGADLSGGVGGPDIRRMKAAMDRVVINGIPATALIDGELTKENWKEAAALIGDHVGSYLRETKSKDGRKFNETRTEHIGILDNGKIVPLTYMPPEPVAPTTKVGFFSGRRVRNMRRLEEERYKEALARKEFWQKRNSEAREQSKVYEKLRAPQEKNNTAANHDLTFMELVDSLQKENKTAAKKTGEKHVVKNGPQAEHGKDVKKVAVGP